MTRYYDRRIAPDLDQYRRISHDTWDRIATFWDEQREFIWSGTKDVSHRMAERLDAKPGDTVLELAAGTGDTGYLVAERLGEEGKLISTDFAESMVDAARKVAGQLGLRNTEHRVLDAEKMDLEDSSVDGVIARWGYMLMADPAAALAETRRVLKDGKRLVFAVWGTPDKNLWAGIPGLVMVAGGHMPAPEPGAPGIFAMADPQRIRELVTGAGFSNLDIEQVDVRWNLTDPAQHWETMVMKLAGPIAEAVGKLDPAEQAAVREEVAAKIEPVIEENGNSIPGVTHVVTAS